MSEVRIQANSEDDDIPCLSAETFKALQEFYAEREAIGKDIDENWVWIQTAFVSESFKYQVYIFTYSDQIGRAK